MNTPTYKEQFDKVTSAYIDNTLEPYVSCACFVGNILGQSEWACTRNDTWDWKERYGNYFYTRAEIIGLEENFLTILNAQTYNYKHIWSTNPERKFHPNYENALYNAMSSTLDMLREIHESKGEITEVQEFTKRESVK